MQKRLEGRTTSSTCSKPASLLSPRVEWALSVTSKPSLTNARLPFTGVGPERGQCMRKFGKANGGGRRSAPRCALPLAAVYSTVSKSASVTVADVSCTGVRLRGTGLPAKGDLVEITMETVRTFGIVVRATDAEFAVAFDTELSRFEVERLRQRCGLPGLAALSPEERQGIEDWLLCVSH